MPRRGPNREGRISPLPLPDPASGRVYTGSELREIDRLAADRYRIASIILMENAAIAILPAARRLMKVRRCDRVVVVCGPGNNGGDGLALARHLHNAGHKVRLLLAASPEAYRGDAAANLLTAQRMGLPISDPSHGSPPAQLNDLLAPLPGRALVVDALFGTGLDRPVTGPMLSLIGSMNGARSAGAALLAVDIPSGLDCDSGRPLGVAVRADLTVSCLGMKLGFLALEAQEFLGEVAIAGIGAPRELVESLGRPAPTPVARGPRRSRPINPSPGSRPSNRSRRRGH